MTNSTNRNLLYTIMASGRDSEGTYFEFGDAVRGWRAAAQATGAMFRRAPDGADYKIYEGDPDAGTFRDVTVDLLADAENAFHKASEHRSNRTKVRRSLSTYQGAA